MENLPLFVIDDEYASQENYQPSEEEITGIKNPFHAPSLDKLYKVVQCISRGSPCSVFIVRAVEDGKFYALKKIECHDESDAKKVFCEENSLKDLNHPNICQYKEFFITYEKQGSTVFINIISQYFPQGNLRSYIKDFQDKKEDVPEQVVKKIFGEVLSAVVYIHEKDYIHRDIKPNNIYQHTEAMILGDMGAFSIMGDMRTNTRQTFKGTVFMAPEIGQMPHTKKSDLYSVGGVLLNILTTATLNEDEFYHKLGEIKEQPAVLNDILDIISNKYSKPMINIVQMLLRHKHTNRPSTLEFIKSGFVQECMAQADTGQHKRGSWEKQLESTKIYSLTENRDNVWTVLRYIADIIEDEDCVADGLSALADILLDNDRAHEQVDQTTRSMLLLALWTHIFNKDVQVAGCYVLSNLVVFVRDKEKLGSPPNKGLLKLEHVLDHFSVPNTVQRNYVKVATWHIDGRSGLCPTQGTLPVQTDKFGLPAAISKFINGNVKLRTQRRTKPDDLLFTSDTISIIHKIMNGHEYSPEVQLAAVNLILALSADEQASQTIVQMGGIKDIVNAIRHARYHATLNAVCCLALWSLCADSENLKVAVKENAVKEVCLALSIHKVSPDVCEAAAAALVSLLLDDSSYDLFSELDCSDNLVAAINLHTKNVKVVKNCCKVLATAVEANEDCAYRFISSDNDDDSPNGILTIMKAYKVHKDNTDMVESIVKLLLELSLYEDIATEMESAHVGQQVLTEVYNRYKQNEAIMRPAVKALERINAVVMPSTKKASLTTILAPLPNRPYRFEGEVKSNCKTMLKNWQRPQDKTQGSSYLNKLKH